MATLSRSHLLRRFEKYNIDEWRDSDKIEDFEVRFVNETKGKGLFSRRKFEKNDFLLFYRGEKISSKRYDELIRNGKNEYVFANLTHKLYIDATEETSGLARFINDCGDDKPNAKARVHTDVNGQRHIKIVCERPINAGEEITYDYQGEFMPWRKPKSRKRKIRESETASTLEVNQSDVEEVEPPLTQEELREQQALIEAQKREENLNMEAEDLFEDSDQNCQEIEPPSPPPLQPKPTIIKSDQIHDQDMQIEGSERNHTDAEPEPVMINFPLQKRGQRTVEKPHARVRQPPEVSNPPVYPSTASLKKSCSKDKPQATTSLQLVGSITPTNYPNDLFLCLHCNFPMTEAHEMIEHQIECGTRPFKGKTEIVDGKRKHYFLYCTECSAICNRTNFPLMKEHVESTHCKQLKCGETYLFFRMDEETEALDVSHSKMLCSSPSMHISPEDQDYEPPLKRLNKNSSEELEDDEDSDELETDCSVQGFIQKKQMKKTTPAPSSSKPYKCEFCGDAFGWLESLRRHFEKVHQVKDKKILTVIQRCHLMTHKENSKKHFCTECIRMFDQKFRHKIKQSDGSYQQPHEPNWIVITSVWQLPQQILRQVVSNKEESDERFLSKRTFNFKTILNKYQAMKEKEISRGRNSNINRSNIKGKMEKLRKMVIVTKGMTEPRKLSDWIQMYPKVSASKSILNMLNELDIFIDTFLKSEIGSFQQKVDISAFKGQIKLLRKNESRAGRTRKQLLKTTAANSLPNPKEIDVLRKRIMEYLEKKFQENLQGIRPDEFRTLTYNLMALIFFRNSSRCGTISLFRTEFLENRHVDENLKLCAIELAPKELHEMRKGPGERKRIQQMQKILERTHKNFYCEGVKIQVITDKEMQLIDEFALLRIKLGVEHTYLFAPMKVHEKFDSHDQKNYGKNWSRSLPKQHGLPHLKFNATLLRKLMASIWKENVPSTLHREALNQHTGHTEATAFNYYEVSTSKKRNAALTSHYTDLVYSQGSLSDNVLTLESNTEQQADRVDIDDNDAQQDNTNTDDYESEELVYETDEEDETQESDGENEGNSENESESDDSQQTDNSDGEEEKSVRRVSTFPKANPVTFVKSSTGTTIVNSASLDPKVIATMIQTRDQRTNRQKYVLRPEDCQELANLYILFVQGTSNFSALYRSKALPLSIDAAKSIFKQVTKLRTEYLQGIQSSSK